MRGAGFEARAARANRRGYAVQAAAVGLWWAGLLWVPGVYEVFAFPGVSREVFFAFGLPDAAVLAGGAVWAARGGRGARLAGAAVLGGFAYAGLWCLTVSVQSGGGWFGTMVMGWAVMLNVLLLGRQSLFRTAGRAQGAGVRTAVQSAGIWGLCLGVFPGVIAGTFGGEVRMAGVVVGAGLFAAGSALGVRSAVEMVRRGHGTPLPMDAASALVTGGPYGRVRNPMAVAGLVQGLGVAAGLGSWAVALYVMAGGAVWHFFVRPEEELFLFRQFGEAYEHYIKETRCWIPKR